MLEYRDHKLDCVMDDAEYAVPQRQSLPMRDRGATLRSTPQVTGPIVERILQGWLAPLKPEQTVEITQCAARTN